MEPQKEAPAWIRPRTDGAVDDPYHVGIFGRLLLRLAILAASLAWAGFVFTQTLGDPGRGERIAVAVLADDEARAEVTAPITSAVLSATGLPDDQRPYVTGQVDRILRDPAGAQTFVDPFAGAWARMLGEDDPRPAELDLVGVLTALGPEIPDAGASAPITGRLPVSGVPLPRTRIDGMSSVRSVISASVAPLALVATGALVAAFLLGDRRRVLRRAGVWAIAAGLSWMVVPPLVVWAARRWAPGADAVVAATLDEALSGLLPVTVALVAAGATALGTSFAVSPARESRTATGRRRTTGTPTAAGGRAPASTAATRPVPTAAGVTSTREMPQVDRPDTSSDAAAPTTRVVPLPGSSDRTVELPLTDRPGPGRPADEPAFDDERDALWDYYGS